MSEPLTDLELRDVEHFGPNWMSNDTLVRLVAELRQSRAELEGYRCWLRGDQWGCSTDIAGGESYGYGKLDDNGFWEFPIPLACVEMSRQLRMERAFCICGCPESDHESYGEDGEACEDQHHECIRVCAAAASITEHLRAQLKAKDEALRLAHGELGRLHAHRCRIVAADRCSAVQCDTTNVLAAISAARGEK